MWRQLACRRLPSSRLLIPKPSPCTRYASRRFISQKISPHSGGYTTSKRVFTISIAFLAGLSIYFFLEDPIPRVVRSSLSSRHFVPSLVLSTEDSGPNSKLLKLAVPQCLIPPTNPGPIWSVYIKDDDIQVERAYTPLTGIDDRGHMTFWIRRYPNGEVGRWLHAKRPGDKVELRGPLTTWPWKENTWDEVVMISGGTGITPFIQLFNTVISKSNESSNTQFTLLHSSRTPEELPPTALLDPLLEYSAENPEKFKLHFFVDKETSSKRAASISQLNHLNTGRITDDVLQRFLKLKSEQPSWWSKIWYRSRLQGETERKILFLVCGPEPMIAAIAGPYGRNFSQGPIGGTLGRMGYSSNQVYKL
ncbi:hypothetical protein CPB84DRAFT_1729588 [Gymnopilus junonius]|uniref:FAD-binding FR-type domain-containing protein n=1 Tax=Gymnopilus junonius TaxID=109634 RepID=A0A9P5NP71_GYMJU|nr:hypothetical protein CPB84DRAFT_1729588 [Gymnopilus junonius]